jgi:protein involved in sex pheromone biosynthesis
MTKKTFVLIITLVFLLAACSIGGDGNTNEPNNDQETTNNQNGQNTDAPVEDPVYSPAASVAVCTAASEPVEITLDQFDHVKGAVEDYKITLIEYGDFQ